MHMSFRNCLRLITFGLLAGLWVPNAGAATIYAVATGNSLISFDSATPGSIETSAPITGLQLTESIYGIDFRPSTGQLFALAGIQTGSTITAQLYTIDPETAIATDMAPGPETIVGTKVGFDFNPVVDRIRVTTNEEANLRFDPNTGALAGTDSDLTAGNVVEVAYDRNFPGATVTTLFGIDADSDSLVTIGGINGTPSPNLGAVTVVGPTGFDFNDISALDVSGGSIYAMLRVSAVSSLYLINPASGAATLVGNIGSNPPIFGGMAVAPQALILEKAKVKLNFGQPLKDSISISGLLAIPDNFVVTGKVISVNFGGVVKTFTLDEKGKATVGTDKASVKVKAKSGVVLAQDAKYKIDLKKGDFAAALEDEGLIDGTVDDVLVNIVISIEFGGTLYQTTATLTYKAKTGKTGSAK